MRMEGSGQMAFAESVLGSFVPFAEGSYCMKS